jgi:hypothetical protein
MNDDQRLYEEEHPHQHIQTLIKEVREKAYRAAGMLKELRVQNRTLEDRNKELEGVVLRLQKEVEEKTVEIAHLQVSMKSPSTIDVGDRLLYFSADEREALERQINELLARVSSHLR